MSLRKKQGETVYEVYPMELQRIQIGSQRTFDRSTRGRSWIILDLELPPGRFIPKDRTGLVTADGSLLTVGRIRT